jgi:hypothetical protein
MKNPEGIKKNIRTKIKYAQVPFSIKVILRYLRIIPRFIIKRYPLTSSRDNLSCQPLFIISSGRSGTTLMRSMLVAGGQIAIPPETKIIHTLPAKFIAYHGLSWEEISRLIISAFESQKYFHLWEFNMSPAYQSALRLPKNQRSLAKIIDEVFLAYANEKAPGAKIWGDQSPLHTYYLRLISRVFPEAKYVHLLRDGRDVISSLVERYGDDYLNEAIYRWKTSLKRSDEMRKRLNDQQYLEVRYEYLVEKPESVLKEVSQFLNIDYSSDMLDYWKLPSTIEHRYNPFHKNLGKPVFTSSIGKWRERLTPSQQEVVLHKISGDLENLGYKL